MWRDVRVGDVAKAVGGSGFPKEYQLNTDKPIPFYKVSDMNIAGNEIEMYSANNYVDNEDLKEIKAKWHPSGTIIFPKIGGAISTNKKRILKSKAAFDNNVMGVIPNKSEILPEFLYKIFLSLDLYELSNKANPPSITNGTVEDIEFLLPPLEEQERIVAKLDNIFGEIDKVKINNQDKLIKIKSLAYQAIEMELNYCELNYKKFPISSVVTIQPNKKIVSDKLDSSSLVTFINMNNLGIEKKYSSSNDLRKLSDVIKSYQYFEENDVLLAKITPCFENGKLSIAKNLSNKVGFGSSEFVVFRPNKDLSSDFVYYNLLRKKFRVEGENNMAGAVGHKRVRKEFISEYLIAIPPLEIQQKIVKKLDKIWEGVFELENIINKKLSNYKALLSSVLREELKNKAS